MNVNELFKVFNFECGNIIIERMWYDAFEDATIIDEDVLRSLKDGGAWLSEYGNKDIMELKVIDYDSRKSALGVTTLRVLVII